MENAFAPVIQTKTKKNEKKGHSQKGNGPGFSAVHIQRQKRRQKSYTARVTLPERKQRVQAYTRLGVPLTTAFTRLMLGFQVRLERR